MTREELRSEMNAQFWRAKTQDRGYIEVNAGELYRTLSGNLPKGAEKSAIADCCAVMRNEFRKGEAEVVFEAPKMVGAALTIRYTVPRPKAVAAAAPDAEAPQA
jgi:hypothetical protein